MGSRSRSDNVSKKGTAGCPRGEKKQAGVLSIRAYQVLPISPTSLALVWVEECDSWKGGLICKWLSTGMYVGRCLVFKRGANSFASARRQLKARVGSGGLLETWMLP